MTHRKNCLLVFTAGLLASLVFSSPALAADPWYDTAWEYRVKVTVDPAEIEGNGALQGFPVLLSLNGADNGPLFDAARADGADLFVTTLDGSERLASDLVSFDDGGESAQLWFRSDVLSKTENEFYLYYGNGNATPPDASETWEEYSVVYHYENSPTSGTLLDSGPDGVDALARGYNESGQEVSDRWTSSDLVNGKIGKGWHYDGREITHTFDLFVNENSWSASAWVYLDNHSTDFFLQGNPCFFHFSSQASNVSHDGQYQNGYCGNQDWRWLSSDVDIQSWHYWTWVCSESDNSITLYYDGQETPITWKNPNGDQQWQPHGIGEQGKPVGILGPMWYNSLDAMSGIGDEFRLRPGTLSPEWVRTEFRNQSDPHGFVAFGDEQARSVSTESTSLAELKSLFSNP